MISGCTEWITHHVVEQEFTTDHRTITFEIFYLTKNISALPIIEVQLPSLGKGSSSPASESSESDGSWNSMSRLSLSTNLLSFTASTADAASSLCTCLPSRCPRLAPGIQNNASHLIQVVLHCYQVELLSQMLT